MFVADTTITEQILLPLRSSLTGPFLLGTTQTSEARVLLSFPTDEFALLASDTVVWDSYTRKIDTTINGKDTTIDLTTSIRKSLKEAIQQDSIYVSFCQLRIDGDATSYRFGDTTDNSISFGVYELGKDFSALATWDSVYDASGITSLYTPFAIPVGQFVNTSLLPALDETVSDPRSNYRPDIYTYNESGVPVGRIAIDKNYMQRMLSLSMDSAGRSKMFGLALHPTGMRSITRFSGTIVLQVNMRKVGDTKLLPWIRRFNLTVFNLVHTPNATSDEAVLQGGRKHVARITLNLDGVDSSAIIFDGELTFPIDKQRSEFGTNFQDQGVVAYSPLEGADTVVFATRITADRSKIQVSNFGQRFRRLEGQTVQVGTISMGRFLEEYVQKPGKQQPIFLASQTNTRLDRIHFLKSTNGVGNRPFLRIFYSKPTSSP
jgi:hypothetical protein